eukprot:6210341-Pleurochrysis_carterae.AAC.2
MYCCIHLLSLQIDHRSQTTFFGIGPFSTDFFPCVASQSTVFGSGLSPRPKLAFGGVSWAGCTPEPTDSRMQRTPRPGEQQRRTLTNAWMEAVWEQIRKSPNLNQIGPLARAAKLETLSDDLLPVKLASAFGASLFRMVTGGSYQNMENDPRVPNNLEIYLFTAYYSWPEMFATVPCTNGQSVGSQ